MAGQDDATRYRFRVAVVEDHLLQRRATEEVVASDPGLHLVWSGPTVGAFRAWLHEQDTRPTPHLVLLDLLVDRGPRVTNRDLKELTRRGMRVVLFSALSVPHVVQEAMQAGVHGVVSKRDSEDDLRTAIWSALNGRSWLTSELPQVLAADGSPPELSIQERHALVLYASGRTLNEVAAEMNVRPNTVKKYLTRVKNKYAASGRPAHSKLDLYLVAKEHGYLER